MIMSCILSTDILAVFFFLLFVHCATLDASRGMLDQKLTLIWLSAGQLNSHPSQSLNHYMMYSYISLLVWTNVPYE